MPLLTDPSTILPSLATAIAARLATIAGLKVYDHEPGVESIDQMPAATVEGPTELTRTEPEAGESQLGAWDWLSTWAVRIYVKLDDSATAEAQIRGLLGQVVAAFDTDRSLGGSVLDSSLVRSGRNYTARDEAHLASQAVMYECELRVWSLVQ